MALPDMARALLPQLPPAVELVVDERERPEPESYRQVARELGAEKGWRRAYREAMSDVGREIADVSSPVAGRDIGSTPLRVGVVGHEYLLSDTLLTLDVVERLRRFGVEPVLAQSVEPTRRSLKPRFMPNWMFERELIRAAAAMIGPGGVDGLLLVSSFACGTSAVTNELIRLMVHDSGREVPVLQLLFDEHTGEAGLATRLESFLDVMRLKRR
jgi:predicted nucleotide-binding protein (sugar kinase/HSP70/actin superfamily)